MQDTTSTAVDPLHQQSMHNKISGSAPVESGSHPPVEAEKGEETHETNLFEEKLDKAFGQAEHDKEQSGAGVGNHPKA